MTAVDRVLIVIALLLLTVAVVLVADYVQDHSVVRPVVETAGWAIQAAKGRLAGVP